MLQLSFSPSTPMNSHVRVLCLLVSLLLDCCGLAVVCGLLGASHGMHTLSFMAAEVRSWSYNCIEMEVRFVKKKKKHFDHCAPQMIMVLGFQFFSSLLVLTASWFIFLIYYVRSIITFLGNNKDSRCTVFSHHAGNAKSCSMKFLHCMK